MLTQEGSTERGCLRCNAQRGTRTLQPTRNLNDRDVLAPLRPSNQPNAYTNRIRCASLEILLDHFVVKENLLATFTSQGTLVPANATAPFTALTVVCLLGATFHITTHCAVLGRALASGLTLIPVSKLLCGLPSTLDTRFCVIISLSPSTPQTRMPSICMRSASLRRASRMLLFSTSRLPQFPTKAPWRSRFPASGGRTIPMVLPAMVTVCANSC